MDELAGATFGVLGYGDIGKSIISILIFNEK